MHRRAWTERGRAWLAVMIILIALDVRASVDFVCGAVTKPDFGPYDYRDAPRDKLARVENYHFGPDVQALRKGSSTEFIGRDLTFVLRYFPNHTRALKVLVDLAKREKTNKPKGISDPVECWFERAVSFRPADGAVALMYGLWLVHRGEPQDAAKQLESARKHAVNDSNYAYTLGLAYLELGDYENALEAAHKAYALGYPLSGLRDRLKRLNKWREPSEPEGVSADPGRATEGSAGSNVKR